MNEHQAREYVHKLRRFYTAALIYAVVNLGLILIWAISGGGYFWPIWVIIVWGIGLGFHAFSLGLIPQLEVVVPFMTAEWEEQEIRRVMKSGKKGKEMEEKLEPFSFSLHPQAKKPKRPARRKTSRKTKA